MQSSEKRRRKLTLEDRLLKLRESREKDEEEDKEERGEGGRTASFRGESGAGDEEEREGEKSLRESDFLNFFQEAAIDGEKERRREVRERPGFSREFCSKRG